MSQSLNDPMLEMFIFENSQLLEQLDGILLDAEKDDVLSSEKINEIFRIMHTIKGSAAMMMYENILSVAHKVEDVFFFIREKKLLNLDCTLVCDLVLKASDFIKEEIQKIQKGYKADGDSKKITDELSGYLTKLTTEYGKNNKQKQTLQAERFYITSKQNKLAHGYEVLIRFDEECQMENVRAYTIVHSFKEICGDLLSIPTNLIEDSSTCEIIKRDGLKLYFQTDESLDKIKAILDEAMFLKKYDVKIMDDYFGQIKDVAPKFEINDEHNISKSASNEQKQNDKDSLKSIRQNIISVNIAKVDRLLDLVGEIVISESMVVNHPELQSLEMDNFLKEMRQLQKLTSELQDAVMSIRMVPISIAFQKMNRIVREMGKKLKKEVILDFIGDETEVDKNIIDNLTDPLMHIIRNAMDHGIEENQERLKKGKPYIGHITLKAQNTGSFVEIIISDDGKGFDREKIIRKARSNGLLTKSDYELADKDIFSFVMLPGFSTNDDVTEFSGRGVGMDVVKKNIERLGGNIYINSILDKGSDIFIRIPLTLAIIDGMQLAVGNSIYIIPSINIKEAFCCKEQDVINDLNGNEMVFMRGKCYPLIRLHNYLKVKSDIDKLDDGIVVMVENDDKAVCIFIDKLLGEQQTVVKPIPAYFDRTRLNAGSIGGCTILGDGKVSLIIDVNSLIGNII